MTIALNANKLTAIAVTCNATSQNVALPTGGGEILRLSNLGPQPAFVQLSNDANLICAVPTASGGGGLCIGANVTHQDLMIGATDTRIACVSTGNSTLYIARGKQHA
jgi:hypothetical protein